MARLMLTVRRLHAYVGVFIAPSVIFFAITGSLQIYNLHEDHGDYHAPALIEQLASVHKDQVRTHPHPPGPPDSGPQAAPGPGGHDDDHDHAPGPATLLLKAFFLGVAICLALSTLGGVWMAALYNRNKPLTWLLLAAGAVIPTVLALV